MAKTDEEEYLDSLLKSMSMDESDNTTKKVNDTDIKNSSEELDNFDTLSFDENIPTSDAPIKNFLTANNNDIAITPIMMSFMVSDFISIFLAITSIIKWIIVESEWATIRRTNSTAITSKRTWSKKCLNNS